FVASVEARGLHPSAYATLRAEGRELDAFRESLTGHQKRCRVAPRTEGAHNARAIIDGDRANRLSLQALGSDLAHREDDGSSRRAGDLDLVALIKGEQPARLVAFFGEDHRQRVGADTRCILAGLRALDLPAAADRDDALVQPQATTRHQA